MEIGPAAELLDEAEDVVPPSGVEAGGVVPQLVEDLVHLEGGGDGLDQDSGLDRPPQEPEVLLGCEEDVVPQPRFEVALQLGEVEVRSRALVEQLPGVVEEGQPEVDQAGRGGFAVDEDAGFVEVPPARPHDEGRRLLGQLVAPAVGVDEGDLAPHRVAQVPLPLDKVRPRGCQGVLEVGHEDPRPRVQAVDHHLALDRSGDLDPPVQEVLGHGRHRPVSLPDGLRGTQEVGQLGRVERRLALGPSCQQPPPLPAELAVQSPYEPQRTRREDLFVTRGAHLDAVLGHGSPFYAPVGRTALFADSAVLTRIGPA
jgi:hypothetical protein